MVHSKSQQITSWAPIVGRWTTEGEVMTYLGIQEGCTHPFGLCASNLSLTEGSVKVSVELSATKDASGRILLGYRSPNESYLSVGIGGYKSAYVLSEFSLSQGWRALSLAGSEDNLLPDTKYEIEVRIAGQKISLIVNDVKIFEHVLDRPLISGQTGLFAWGNQRVTFSNMAVNKATGKVFVVMQFSEPYQQLYSEVIKPVTKDFDLEAYHVGEVFGPGVILQDISEGIIESKIVIAEVTPANQNVFYELGYAHALGKPTILLAERGKQLPFDITGYRCLFYENTIGGKQQVEEALRKHLQAISHE